MSFQYINPYQNNNFVQYPYMNMPLNNQSNFQYAIDPIRQPIYPTNSFYFNNISYPYSNVDIFNTNIDSTPYKLIGTIPSPSGETAYLYKLSNGQKVGIIPRKNQATIVKTFINAGSLNETDSKRGVMHTDEHGVFKGSSTLKDGDVFKKTALMGASTNASTDYAKVDYYITAPFMDKNNLKESIEIQGDMIYNPTFDVKAMEEEKGPICSEISMINDNPITNAFDKAIRNLYQIQSNSLNLVAGSIDTVKGLSRDDMLNYHQTYYAPENLTTVVVGDVDVDETIKMISDNYRAKNPKDHIIEPYKEPLKPIEKPVRQDIISTKTNSSNFILTFSGPKPKDSKDFVISSMIDYYLSGFSSSPLKNEFEKLSSGYDAEIQKVSTNENDPYTLVSMITTTPENEQKALDTFYDAINQLQRSPLSDEDIESLKNLFRKYTEFAFTDSETLCDLLGTSITDNAVDYFSNYKEIINSVTKEDIMNFVRKYYDLNKVSIVAVHPGSVDKSKIEEDWQNSKYSYNNAINTLNENNAKYLSFKGSISNNKKEMIKPLKKINSQISFKGEMPNPSKDVKELVLKNNTRIALNDTPYDVCVYKWCVNTPPIKPKNAAIPSVLGYMFQKGTNYKNQTELEKYKEKNGIGLDVFTNGKSIEINANCLKENAQKTLDLMQEVMYHPNLTEDDFNDAKKFIKDNLLMSSKDAGSNAIDNLYPGFFPTDKNILAEIDNLQYQDILDFYNDLLKNASSNFIATMPYSKDNSLENMLINSQSKGNINFKDAIPQLHPVFTPQKEAVVVVDIDDLNQAQIIKTYQFPLSGNIEDEVKFELLNSILGGSPNSRLFQDLREKQNLAYSVSSSVRSFENSGILSLKIQTTTDHKEQNVQSFDNVQKSLEGFDKHTDGLMKNLVSDEELKAAKMKLKQQVIGQCQDPLSETELLSINMMEPYSVKRIDKYLETIDKITKEDIKNTANFIFSHKPTTSILASEDTINSQIDYLKTQGKIQQI